SLLAANSGWTVTPTINATTGQIAIALSSTTPIINTLGGSLVTIDFHQLGEPSDLSPGTTSIGLVGSINPTGQQVVLTELEDAQGMFTLTPSPAAGFDQRLQSVVLLPASPAGALVGTPQV